MRARDPVVADLDVLTHEAGHAVAAVYYGARLLRVIGSRHFAQLPNTQGSAEWLGGDLTPEQHAVVLLAGC